MVQAEKYLRREVENKSIVRIASIVEKVLQSSFFSEDPFYFNMFAGKLSTVPNLVSKDITSDLLKGKCGIICQELKDKLIDAGMPVEMSISGERNSSWHRYLRTMHYGFEILTDPSLGQIIQGHNHVFVGTRSQLKQLVLNPKTSLINTQGSSPTQVFLKTWGSFATPLKR